MVGRGILGVATGAISRIHGGMIKAGRLPCGGGMAVRTLTREMVGWCVLGMAACTISGINRRMIEVDIFPRSSRVAAGAVTSKMVGRCILGVASGALRGQIGKIAIYMAGSAIDCGVDAGERPESVECARAAGWKGHIGGIDISRIF